MFCKFKKIKQILSLICIVLGGLIYICYRSTNLLMFHWFKLMGIETCIETLRNNVEKNDVNTFIKYNLPDGLWLLSYLLIVDNIWVIKSKRYYIFILFLPFCAFASEIIQIFVHTIGTFDIKDILCYLCAFTVFYIIKFTERVYNNKKIKKDEKIYYQ